MSGSAEVPQIVHTSVVGGLGATEKNAVTVTPSRGEKGTPIGRILTGQAFAGIAVALQNCYTPVGPTADAASHSKPLKASGREGMRRFLSV